MKTHMLITAVFTASVAVAASAQVPPDNPRVVPLPPLTITGTTVQCAVTYDPARHVYRYDYSVSVPSTARASVDRFFIDVTGRIARPQTDSDLQNNYFEEFPTHQLQPPTTIPVGIILSDPSTTRAGRTTLGQIFFAFANPIAPGQTRTGLSLESKFPAAPRKVRIVPDDSGWDAITDAYQDSSEDIVFEPNSPDQFEVRATALGPSDPDLSQLFNGGGQSPAEVNPFLRYVSPTQTKTKLPAGSTSVWVTVVYGDTTDPASFTADLNGADVRSRFHPAPGEIESVSFALGSGTSKLQLSIQGTTSSGRVARDTDTLTFVVP